MNITISIITIPGTAMKSFSTVRFDTVPRQMGPFNLLFEAIKNGKGKYSMAIDNLNIGQVGCFKEGNSTFIKNRQNRYHKQMRLYK